MTYLHAKVVSSKSIGDFCLVKCTNNQSAALLAYVVNACIVCGNEIA